MPVSELGVMLIPMGELIMAWCYVKPKRDLTHTDCVTPAFFASESILCFSALVTRISSRSLRLSALGLFGRPRFFTQEYCHV